MASVVIGLVYKIEKSVIDQFYSKAMERKELDYDSPDYLEMGFSDDESFIRFMKGGTAVVGFVFILTGAALAQVMTGCAALLVSAGIFWEWLYIVYDWFYSPDTITASEVSLFISTTFSLMSTIIGFLSIYHATIVSGAWVADTGVVIAVNAALIAAIALGIYNLVTETNRWKHDWNDCNGEPAEYDNFEDNCSSSDDDSSSGGGGGGGGHFI